MEVSKLEQTLNIRLPDWQSQLDQTLSEYLEQQ
jgi:dTDP-4-dehydrorhamnose reductase